VNAQQLWQSQACEAPRISLDYVRLNAHNLDRRTRQRNAIDYALAMLGVGYVLWTTWDGLVGRPLLMAAVGCYVLFVLYYTFVWHRLASVRLLPADAGLLDTLRYQRRQLERQRDARRGSWRWWFPPLLPGFGLLAASLYWEFVPVPWVSIWAVPVAAIVSSALGLLFLEYEANGFQREIDALDSLAKPE